jgi:hypothetical protein
MEARPTWGEHGRQIRCCRLVAKAYRNAQDDGLSCRQRVGMPGPVMPWLESTVGFGPFEAEHDKAVSNRETEVEVGVGGPLTPVVRTSILPFHDIFNDKGLPLQWPQYGRLKEVIQAAEAQSRYIGFLLIPS